MLTDIDSPASRPPHPEGLVPAKKRGSKRPVLSQLIDPMLDAFDDGADLLLAEAKV